MVSTCLNHSNINMGVSNRWTQHLLLVETFNLVYVCAQYMQRSTLENKQRGVFLNTGSGVNLYICIHQFHQRILRYWPIDSLKSGHVRSLLCIVDNKTTQFDVWILKQCLLSLNFCPLVFFHTGQISYGSYTTPLSVSMKLIQQVNHFSNRSV